MSGVRYLTDEQAADLARAAVANEVFVSDQIRNAEDVPLVFMVLLLAGREHIAKWKEDGVVHLYERVSKRMPTGINGLPCFLSAAAMTAGDYAKFREYEEKLRAAMSAVLPKEG